ncbi:MAG: NAD-dependent epimerase/dehydratase family protein [Rhodospirillales bacterium]|nr:NAD-dependent epimerase/dehydratase family protein [Rhodospirillales bacterium]
MTEKKSVLVTGGAGFLGSIMVPALLESGCKVTVLDNFMFKQNSLTTSCANPDFSVVKGDARNEELLKELLKNADTIIPLAALVGAPLCSLDPIGATSLNLDGQLTLLKLLSPSQQVLMPITNSGYGVGEEGKFCTEETPLKPISLYGKHKVEIEDRALERENTISFRLATVFGMAPRMRTDLLVNDFVYRAVYDRAVVLFEGHFKRNYIHIRDVSRAFLHAMENFETMKGEPYNVGLSDANLSKRELCNVIIKHIPSFVPVEAPIGEDPDKRDYIVSNEKIEATGFKPAHSLDMGIQELIKGYTMIRDSVYGNV